MKIPNNYNHAPAGECSYCWDWCPEGTLVCPNPECKESHKETRKELRHFERKKYLTTEELNYYLELKKQLFEVTK